MLTSDAKTMIFVLYKEYKSRRNHKVPKRDAKFFADAASVHQTFFPDWQIDDVEETMRELDRNGFLENRYAEDTIWHCYLSDRAIAKLENQPKETFLSLADFLAKFIP